MIIEIDKNIKVIGKKNAIIPIDWNKKSDIMLPLMPKRLFIA